MYRPKLSQLRFFCAIVEMGSIAAAADKMNCVASNITMRLKELENDIGHALFTRENKSLTITPAGRKFYQDVKPLVEKCDELPFLWEKDKQRAIFKIGALDVAFLTCIYKKLPEFIKNYPDIDVSIIKGFSFALERMVLEQTIDLAITDGPVQTTQLQSVFAFHQPLYLVMPEGIKKESADIIKKSNFYLFNQDCFYRQRVEVWLEQKGYQPRTIQTIESYDVITACLKLGSGFSCMPESIITQLYKQGHILNVRPMPELGPTDVYFVWCKTATSEIRENFISMMKT